jgi:DNA polymerase I
MRKAGRKTVALLDTHAIIHRAYHALPPFTSPSGVPVGALYGLVAMLLKIISELRPDYIVACSDTAAPTARHEAYEDYKGTRAKIDDELVAQLKEAGKVFEAFGIPLYEKAGFEADDLLGTIAEKLRANQDADVIISSGDMDMLQLVDDSRVQVFTLRKGINDTVLYDEQAVKERFGFAPSLIPDWKGLRGDPSDNIKGVPGIGEKTATDLITNFGSIEDIYTILNKKGDEAFLKKGIKARIVGLLREHEEDARFSKSLATIRLDAPIAFALPDKFWSEEVSTQKVMALFDAFGFRSLRERTRTVLAKVGALAELDRELEEQEEEKENVPSARLAEASAMLWLISSEFTNPTLDDIFAFTKERQFDAAYAVLETELKKLGRIKDVFEKIEKPLVPVIDKMEDRGVLVDSALFEELRVTYQAELENIEKKIYRLAGREFNVSSPKQLGEVLFDELKIIPDRQKKTAGGQRSTRESELEKIADQHPIVAEILEYRELKKLLSTYIENIPAMLDAGRRLHAEFLQTGTTTGRMASQNPNLQNIPLRSERGQAIRHAFIAPEGFSLVSLDYSQIELRIAAILSGDKTLCEIFRSGRDVHTEVASRVFGVAPETVDAEMRRRAKIINFGILYGMGVNALRAQLGSTTAEAHVFLDTYFATFKTLAEYLEETKGFARKHGYTETLFGRRRQFPEMKSTLPYVRAQAERMAINAPIQGTSADLIKLAMVQIDAYLEKEGLSDSAYLLLQVHDELVYEIRKEKEADIRKEIKNIMESVLTPKEANNVPILVSAKSGPDWGSMEKI